MILADIRKDKTSLRVTNNQHSSRVDEAVDRLQPAIKPQLCEYVAMSKSAATGQLFFGVVHMREQFIPCCTVCKGQLCFQSFLSSLLQLFLYDSDAGAGATDWSVSELDTIPTPLVGQMIIIAFCFLTCAHRGCLHEDVCVCFLQCRWAPFLKISVAQQVVPSCNAGVHLQSLAARRCPVVVSFTYHFCKKTKLQTWNPNDKHNNCCRGCSSVPCRNDFVVSLTPIRESKLHFTPVNPELLYMNQYKETEFMIELVASYIGLSADRLY